MNTFESSDRRHRRYFERISPIRWIPVATLFTIVFTIIGITIACWLVFISITESMELWIIIAQGGLSRYRLAAPQKGLTGFTQLSNLVTLFACHFAIVISVLLGVLYKLVAVRLQKRDGAQHQPLLEKVTSKARFKPKSLLARIQVDLDHLKLLREKHDAAKSKVQHLTASLDQLNQQMKTKDIRIQTLEATNKQQAQQLKRQQATLSRLANQNANQTKTIANHQAKLADVQKSCDNKLTYATSVFKTNLARAVGDATIANAQLLDMRMKRDELQFDIEYLKCTSEPISGPVSHTSGFSDFVKPFIFVMVDGDAYSWEENHFAQRSLPPGKHAAAAIKSEVENYLRENKDRISIHSQIMVRVFHNAAGVRGAELRTGTFARNKLATFAREFTETGPLFDYSDCGRGKERADSKIQELLHLFIRNPYCHTIFLAAATDNGFARTLEQYASAKVAKEKIVLVHPGHVVRDIAILNYTAVEWHSVFQKKPIPIGSYHQSAMELQDRVAAQYYEKVAPEGYGPRYMIEKICGLGPIANLSETRLGPVRSKIGERRKESQHQQPDKEDTIDRLEASTWASLEGTSSAQSPRPSRHEQNIT